MTRPSSGTIAWCTVVIAVTCIVAYSYLTVHHASTKDFLGFVGNVLPAAAGIIAILLKLDKVEKNTNGALSSQTSIAQQAIPSMTDEMQQLKLTVADMNVVVTGLNEAVTTIRTDINTAKNTFPKLMNALDETHQEVNPNADQHNH